MIESGSVLIDMVWGGLIVCLVGVAGCVVFLMIYKRIQRNQEEEKVLSKDTKYKISLENRQTDEHYERVFEGEIVVGRSPEYAQLILLNDRSVSKQHFKVSAENGQFLIEDLNSSNHTWLNGRRVTGRVPIKTGDRVVAGYYSYLVKLREVS